MDEQTRITIQELAAAAGLKIDPARLPALAAGWAGMRQTLRPLLELDYGDCEPASRFHVPPPADAHA